ncbi:MAG: hypothetical protein H6Q89_155 [Myxococcaceae bacterium]|nr:hypothetical protein [Myxococcaceae bacterium]
MRTGASLLAAGLLFGGGALATEARVNAAAGRQPIAPAIYEGSFGDPAQEARLAAAWGIALPNRELARVALLGMFGQQGVAGGSSGPPLPADHGPAIALYTNYDGQGGRFGHTSIQTHSANRQLSVFAAFDLDAKVTVVLLNQSPAVADAVVLGFQGMGQKGSWRAFELTGDGPIAAAGAGTLYDAVLTRTVQPYSAVLIEYRPVGGILPIRAEEPLPAVEGVEGVAAPIGCSASALEILSLALLARVGFGRRRSPR